jgi:Ca2+-transporting ATPase
MAFATLMFAQLIHVRNLHSNKRSSLTINPLQNKPLIGAIFVSALLALVVLLVPSVREAFSLTTMDATHWWTVAILSFLPVVIVDIFKLLKINGTRREEE